MLRGDLYGSSNTSPLSIKYTVFTYEFEGLAYKRFVIPKVFTFFVVPILSYG